MIKNFWLKLDPQKKRWVVVAGGVVLVFSVVSIFTTESSTEVSKSRNEKIKHVLTDQSTRDVGIDSLSASVKIVSRENAELKKELEKVRGELESTKSKVGNSTDVGRELARLRQDFDHLNKKSMERDKELQNNARSITKENIPDKPSMSDLNRQRKNEIINYKDPSKFFRDAPLPHSKGDNTGDGRDSSSPEKTSIKIASYSQKMPEIHDDDASIENESIYLPSGSILTGVLINGMDAPTAQGARRDPFPSTLRIQKEAILPNRFRADVRECFLIVSGYGDLSSERAYLRGEAFSCVREDGGVIETTLDSYAVGEDGKAGVRGRLVSKQGQVIAKSLLAGLLSGVAEGFDVNPVPVVNTNPGSTTQYQSVFSEQMLQGAASNGASKALERIAQFYIDMAEGIFPVIEVDAGRQVDIIVTKGTKLMIRGGGK